MMAMPTVWVRLYLGVTSQRQVKRVTVRWGTILGRLCPRAALPDLARLLLCQLMEELGPSINGVKWQTWTRG